MAHNEYLQAWVDYGVIGVTMQLVIIVVHALLGFRVLSVECITPVRRGIVALSLVVLISLSVISFGDFYWHSYAHATMTAYCCGILVSPVDAAVPVRVGGDGRYTVSGAGCAARVQGVFERSMMGLLGLGVIGFACWQYGHLAQAWVTQWKFNELEKSGTDKYYKKRLDMLEQVMERYPASEVADCYFMLPHYGGIRPHSESVLRKALAANPRQGYILTMLVTILGMEHKYEEAELLMRRYYPQEGLPIHWGCNWTFFYYYNLLRRSLFCMKQGKQEIGMSMAEYALNMQNTSVMQMSRFRRPKGEPWKRSRGGHSLSEVGAVSREAKRKLQLLKRLGVQKDDSWMQPMEPGGKTALYPQLGIKPDKGKGASEKAE